jgi:seryl-tRNA synthetase
MFDIKWIRDNAQAFDAGLARRGVDAVSARLIALDDDRRSHVTRLQEALETRNAASKEIGRAKASGDEEAAQKAIEQVAKLKSFIQSGAEEEKALTAALETALSELPNLPLDDVPDGADENDNIEIRTFDEKRTFNFEPKEHYELGENLGLMDFEAAARMSGSRFVVLRKGLAKLERALGQFMLDLHTEEHGYAEISPPLLVRDQALYGTGQLPKFAEDLYRTEDGSWLIPTAEVPLTNLARETVHNVADLPMRVTALTHCFRLEAGSAGRDTKGMLRQHQFSKVEMVSITDKDSSAEELERMVSCAEEVLKRLDLHYRVVTLCTGDLGMGARKTYDIEVWLPGQGAYREISSCSLCGDYQARRMMARYRIEGEKQVQYCHTLNGSGIAVGRALIAVLENYQNKDGSISVPNALQSYMGGLEVIGGGK